MNNNFNLSPGVLAILRANMGGANNQVRLAPRLLQLQQSRPQPGTAPAPIMPPPPMDTPIGPPPPLTAVFPPMDSTNAIGPPPVSTRPPVTGFPPPLQLPPPIGPHGPPRFLGPPIGAAPETMMRIPRLLQLSGGIRQ